MSQLVSTAQALATAALLALRGFTPTPDQGLANDDFGPECCAVVERSAVVASTVKPSSDVDRILDDPHYDPTAKVGAVGQDQLNIIKALSQSETIRSQTPVLPGENASYMVLTDPFAPVTLPALGGLAASQF